MPDRSVPGLDVPVERVELVTSDIDVLTEMLGQTYTRYRAWFRRIAGVSSVASAHAATAPTVRAGAVCMPGIATTPIGYLRELRLEHAHRELQSADPPPV